MVSWTSDVYVKLSRVTTEQFNEIVSRFLARESETPGATQRCTRRLKPRVPELGGAREPARIHQRRQ